MKLAATSIDQLLACVAEAMPGAGGRDPLARGLLGSNITAR